jgi:hypothetical protein
MEIIFKWLTGWRMFYIERRRRVKAEKTLRRRTAEYNKATKLAKKDLSRIYNWHRDIQRVYYKTLIEWYERDNMLQSRINVDHPSYQAIIEMDWDAIPHIIEHLRSETHHPPCVFKILAAITGQRPVEYSFAGNYHRMTKAWLKWAKKMGF